MKKLFLLFALVLTMCSTALAHDVPADNEIWYTSSDNMLVVPNEMGYNITNNTYENGKGIISFDKKLSTIEESSFREKSTLTSVILPVSVTEIKKCAFYNCSNLTSLSFADGSQLETIGEGAFDGTSITSLTLPSSVKTIESRAFSETSITTLNLPALVQSIGMGAFCDCYDLASLSFADDSQLGYIGGGAFEKTSITTLNLPASLRSIEVFAFYYCSSLTTVSFADGSQLESIGENAFESTSIISLTLPASVQSIGKHAFYNCSTLTTLAFANGSQLQSIGENAFKGTSIISLTLPASVTSIGAGAFSYCENLTSVTIPDLVTSIGDNAFDGCYFSSLVTNENLNAKENNYWGATMCNGDGVVINDNIVVDCAPWATLVTIPDGITGIGDNAFSDCSGIEGALVIPSTVTSIGESAFADCNKLTSLTVKGGSIGLWAFYGCSGLTSVSLQEGVTSIGNYAFSDCSGIEGTLVIPSTVTSIGKDAFSDCTGITSVSLQEGVTGIGDRAFFGCSGIKGDLVIPSTVKSIGASAFEGCNKLTSIYSLALLPPSMGMDTFESVPKDIPVYVLDDVAYKNAEGWKEFTNIQLISYFKLGDTTYSLDDDGKIVGGELTFTDKDEYQSYRDFTVEKLTYSRTFKDPNWQALYVPFAMSYDEWKDDFDVATINNFHEYTDDMGQTVKTELEVRLVKSGTLKPNHPYLIKAKIADENNPKTIELSTKEICKSDEKSYSCSSMESKYTFTGTYKEMTGLSTNKFIFMSGGKLCMAENDNVALSSQRWYLKITPLGSQVDAGMSDDSSDAKAMQFDIKLLDDEATDIDEITVTRTPLRNSSEAIYNLNGMRVNNSYKGIVIKNGKKIYQR